MARKPGHNSECRMSWGEACDRAPDDGVRAQDHCGSFRIGMMIRKGQGAVTQICWSIFGRESVCVEIMLNQRTTA
jgi:hypothetical protein